MDMTDFVSRLATNAQTIKQLVANISDEQAHWKPDADKWSIVEVINHLYDAEYLDFRLRVDYVLHRPNESPPEIDPKGWVTERNYNVRDLQSSIDNFLLERDKSLLWLATLDNPNWENVFTASWGSIRAGDLFAAWVAHDVLHMRQLSELHYAWIMNQAAPYSVRYAGEW